LSDNNHHITIKISTAGIYLNRSICLPWSYINFPASRHIAQDIFCQVQMIKFNNLENTLTLRIEDFIDCDVSKFRAQSPKYEINQIEFDPESIEKLERLVLYGELDTIDIPISDIDNADSDLLLEFNQPVSKIKFKAGCIETTKSIKGFSRALLVKVINPSILPEYDYIKPYFIKVFGKKTITVHARIGDKNDRSTYHFYSPEIASINDAMIDGIKRLELSDKIKSPKIADPDKSLFTADEYFDGFEAEKGNGVKKSELDLLSEILTLKGIRNAKQLQYIAAQIHDPTHRLHFTLTPDFGFLFYYKGEEMHHYIWELLDSNATYIWSIDGSISTDHFFKSVQQEINFIRQNGRRMYLSHNDQTEMIFSKINHIHANSNLVDGFPKWCAQLNERMV